LIDGSQCIDIEFIALKFNPLLAKLVGVEA
jgi:hypothetical protein